MTMRQGDRPGAVNGITVHEGGGVTCVGPEAVNYFRVTAMISALRFEIRTGMRMSRISVLTAAKRDYGFTGNKVKVLAKLEQLAEALRAQEGHA